MNLILLSNDDDINIDDSEKWDDAMHMLAPSN